MQYWILFWKACFILSLLAFTVLAVIVTIGGAADIRRLLARLRENPTDTD